MGCCGSAEQTSAYASVGDAGYKNVIIYNKSKDKKLFICVNNKKSTINASSFDSFSKLITTQTDADTNTNTSGSVEGAERGNDEETKQMMSSVLEQGLNPILPNKRKKFGVENKLVYITAIDSDGNKLLYDFNTLGESFVYDGQSIDEMEINNNNQNAQLQQSQVAKTTTAISNSQGGQDMKANEQYDKELMTQKYANITFMGLYRDTHKRAMPHSLGDTDSIAKSLQEFKEKLIENEENMGYFAIQMHRQIFYSLGNDESYTKYMKITGDYHQHGKNNLNIKIKGFNGKIDREGIEWTNAVYKIELGVDRNDTYQSSFLSSLPQHEYNDLTDDQMDRIHKLKGKITYMGLWKDDHDDFFIMKHSFGIHCTGGVWPRNVIQSTLNYRLKKEFVRNKVKIGYVGLGVGFDVGVSDGGQSFVHCNELKCPV
eukprot:435841_1